MILNILFISLKRIILRMTKKVSLFQISEDMKIGLTKAAALSTIKGNKKSINDCIIEALEDYVGMDDEQQPMPKVEQFASCKYTVRMTDDLKAKISTTAAKWQLKTGLPIRMNAVVNKAIIRYLERVPSYEVSS